MTTPKTPYILKKKQLPNYVWRKPWEMQSVMFEDSFDKHLCSIEVLR
jgi:hypothetical protein